MASSASWGPKKAHVYRLVATKSFTSFVSTTIDLHIYYLPPVGIAFTKLKVSSYCTKFISFLEMEKHGIILGSSAQPCQQVPIKFPFSSYRARSFEAWKPNPVRCNNNIRYDGSSMTPEEMVNITFFKMSIYTFNYTMLPRCIFSCNQASGLNKSIYNYTLNKIWM